MTKTVQLPFFLSSDRGDDRNTAGNRFRVQLRPSVDIPRKAKNTRVFIQEASVVYSMKNIDSSNKSLVFVVNSVDHIVTIKEGLYDTVNEISDAVATACIEASLTHGLTTVNKDTLKKFQANYVEFLPNYRTSRVEITVKHAGWQLAIHDERMKGFAKLMGFAGTEAHETLASFLSGQQYVTHFISSDLTRVVTIQFRWARHAQYAATFTLPRRSYTALSLKGELNAMIATIYDGTYHQKTSKYYGNINWTHTNVAWTGSGGRWPDAPQNPGSPFAMSSLTVALNGQNVQVTPVFNNLDGSSPITSLIDQVKIGSLSDKIGVQDLFGQSTALDNASNPHATQVVSSTTAKNVVGKWKLETVGPNTGTGSLPAAINRVNSLAIAAPGLATGVHMNGVEGAATLCRFPVTGERGSVIQFEPINPIKSTYQLQGATIDELTIELLDQHGDAVDTQSEAYSCTLVIEYDMQE